MCQERKPFSEFNKGTDRFGLYAYCRPCSRTRTSAAQRKKRSDPNYRAAELAYQNRRYREDAGYRARKIARSRAMHAAVFGRLDVNPCERCGAINAEMHHDDYSKPLDVRFLCRPCHLAEHRKPAA